MLAFTGIVINSLDNGQCSCPTTQDNWIVLAIVMLGYPGFVTNFSGKGLIRLKKSSFSGSDSIYIPMDNPDKFSNLTRILETFSNGE